MIPSKTIFQPFPFWTGLHWNTPVGTPKTHGRRSPSPVLWLLARIPSLSRPCDTFVDPCSIMSRSSPSLFISTFISTFYLHSYLLISILHINIYIPILASWVPSQWRAHIWRTKSVPAAPRDVKMHSKSIESLGCVGITMDLLSIICYEPTIISPY